MDYTEYFELNKNLYIILFSPVFVIIMFQISSYLNMTILSSNIDLIEISDFSEITGIPKEKILKEQISLDLVRFKIIDDNKKIISTVLINLENYSIMENNNIEIDINKLLNLKKINFAKIVKIDINQIEMSENGNIFRQIIDNKEVGFIEFDETGEPIKTEGSFKKFF
ncbi:MAG: hypothetical protein AABZ74_03305 [Cyanobacteriota bacterium]